MKLAIIYERAMDNEADCARTALTVYEEHPGIIIAIDDVIRRARIRRELGEPLYSAIGDTPDYRDVDIWEIESKRKTK